MTISETVAEIRDRARRDAQAVLDLYWSEKPMPVDPVVVARDLGLSVFSAQLGDDVFGMLVGSKAGADMYLDKDQAPFFKGFFKAKILESATGKAIEVRMGNGNFRFVFIDEGKRRASHVFSCKPINDSPGKDCLSRPEFPEEEEQQARENELRNEFAELKGAFFAVRAKNEF